MFSGEEERKFGFGKSLRYKALGPDLHLHSFQWVVWSMPSIPRDAIWIIWVWPIAVKHTIQIGVSAAVVPVSTCEIKLLRLKHEGH